MRHFLSPAMLATAGVLMTLTAVQEVRAQDADASGSRPAMEEVVVTGSRIVRQDYVAESPIMTIDREIMDMSGPQSLDALLNTMPQFAASNVGSSSSPARQGRQNANLRRLGIQRTLVLLDGRRMTPSDPSGAVDLNAIPSSLIDNIEVITGGASAVYGSDAIAGVVNVQLKRDFEGLEILAEYGRSERDDGESLDLTLTFGGNFADGRGNLVAAVNYFDRGPVMRGSRSFFDNSNIAGQLQGGRITTSAQNLPTAEALEDIFIGQYGLAEAPALNAPFAIYDDGTLFSTQAPIVNFDPSRVPYVIDGTRVGFPQGPTYPLRQPLERINTFVAGRYDITETVEIYAQYTRMEYDSSYSRQGWSASSRDGTPQIPITNPFIPPDLAYIMASRPDPDAPIFFDSNTGRVAKAEYDNNYQMNDILIGVRGELPYSDWTFDLYGSHGKLRATEIRSGFIDYDGWLTLVNAPDGGQSVCPGGFNPFAIEMMSQRPEQDACFRMLNHTLQELTTIEQNVIEGVIQGGLMELPAGQIRFAAGATYREQSYDYQPSEGRIREQTMPNQPTDVTGGGYDVWEVFGEVDVPLLSGLPLVDYLATGLAYRHSDYSLAGAVDTYKLSLDWRVNDSIRLRASQQRAIRAPALGELYRPAERASASVGPTSSGAGDPCDSVGRLRDPAFNPNHEQVRQLCLLQGVPEPVIDLYRFSGSSVSGVASGNTALEEETADTFTAGIIWQSTFDAPLLQDLSIAIDYYDIEVEDAIGVLTARVGMNRCFNADGVSNPTYDPNNFFCQLTTRNAEGRVQTQLQPTLNLGGYKTSGVDLQVDWRFALQDLGFESPASMGFKLILAHLISQEIQNLPDEPFTDYAGTIGNAQIDPGAISNPEWRAHLHVNYAHGPFDLAMRYQWIDSMTHASDAGQSNSTLPGVSSRSYVDLLGTWTLSDATRIRVGVTNLFDREPPVWEREGSTDLAMYDLMQRRYFVSVSHSL